MMMSSARARFLLALGMCSLLMGLWAALRRIGWDLPVSLPALAQAHGPLMISGFLGTLITLERAVALDRPRLFVAPLLSATGAVATILGFSPLGPLLITLASLASVGIHALMLRLQPALYTTTMLFGAVVWLVGNLIWLSGAPIFQVVMWWASFLVLTIAGERLELSRLLQLSLQKHASFAVMLGILGAGLVMTVFDFALGTQMTGLGMLALALWLWSHDLARRTVRAKDLTRFIAVCLLLGYAWLAVSGVLGILFGGVMAGLQYDALLHTLFLGFVFSMIFGHAPIILPAVLRLAVPYRSTFYLHLALLHLSLLLRVAGDLLVWVPARQWGGLLNVVAVLVFLANTGYAVFAGNARRSSLSPHPAAVE